MTSALEEMWWPLIPAAYSKTSLKGQCIWAWCPMSGLHCWGVASMSLSLPPHAKGNWIPVSYTHDKCSNHRFVFFSSFCLSYLCHGDERLHHLWEWAPRQRVVCGCVLNKAPAALVRKETWNEAPGFWAGVCSLTRTWITLVGRFEPPFQA